MDHALYRQLPKVDRLAEDPRLSAFPPRVVVGAARQVLDELRADIGARRLATLPDVVELVARRAELLLRGRTQRVINATGVVLHTNLGRAPWAPSVVAAMRDAAGYCNLELDLDAGRRGGRMAGVTALMRHLTDGEAALVVNNGAAAVLLALTALAGGREVVCSRGELVEIGGSFRVPDVVASGGARLVEVGTTNRTRASDYAAAVGDRTAVLLRVHTSNFRVEGFTESPDRDALVAVAARHGLAVVEDVGSGSLEGFAGEPSVRDAVRAGVDVVVFSGDKLLGGPQAGIAVGKAAAIDRMYRHPLYRALRVDKVILSAVERTLGLHAAGERTPVDEMLRVTSDVLATRAEALRAALDEAEVPCEVAEDVGRVGGGALPMLDLPTRVVRVAHPDPNALAARLRGGRPAVVARVADDRLVLDVRTLADADLGLVAKAVARARSVG